MKLTESEVRALEDLEIIGDRNNEGPSNLSWDEFKNEIYSKRKDFEEKGIDFNQFKAKLESFDSYQDLFKPPYPDDGFVVGRRIAPRKFTGVIWQAPTKDSFISRNKEELEKVAKIVEVFSSVSEKTGKNCFLPIYDQWGNCWWPRQQSHQELANSGEE